MAEIPMAKRDLSLEGRFKATADVRIEPAPPASRLVLRARPDAVAPLSRALGVKLPDKPKTSARSAAARTADRTALWIGPDEWLVVDKEGADLVTPCAKVKQPHSAVDVSTPEHGGPGIGRRCAVGAQCRLSAKSVAGRLSCRCLLAHAAG